MVNHEQIRKGLMTYINHELAPLAPKMMGIGLTAFGPLIVEAKTKEFLNSGLLSGTGLVDGDNVDIDTIWRLVKPATAGKWPIEMFGFTFNEADLDKLYRHIKEA